MRCQWQRWRNHWASIKCQRIIQGTPSTGFITNLIISHAKAPPRTRVIHTATHTPTITVTVTVTVMRTNINIHWDRDGALQAPLWVKVCLYRIILFLFIIRVKALNYFFSTDSYICKLNLTRNYIWSNLTRTG